MATRDPAPQGAGELVGPPAAGRTFGTSRRVRLGDVDPSGRARLDAVARYLQDIAADDARDGGLSPSIGWLVRRTLVEVRTAPRFEEIVELTTWCSGIGQRWAERRYSLSGTGGARVDAVSVWVAVDPLTGRPIRLGEDFAALYGASAAGRTVTARLSHPPAPDGDPGRPWVVRSTDFDVYRHVNNAAYWSAVEDALGALGGAPDAPLRAELEYHEQVVPGAEVRLVSAARDDGVDLWLCAGGRRAASARVRRKA